MALDRREDAGEEMIPQ